MLIELSAELLVARDDGVAEPECGFCSHRDSGQALVAWVVSDAVFGVRQGTRRVAGLELREAGLLDEIESGYTEAPYVTVCPEVVGSCQRFAAEEGEG